jgi:hypothetical protein
VFDLDAYLRRVGLSGRPTLAQLHRAHATSIPFVTGANWVIDGGLIQTT